MKIATLSVALAALMTTSALATDVTILTPYISSIPTNEMAQAFKAAGDSRGWNTTVIDTRNDYGQLASRIEDTVNAKPDAIVLISVDQALISDQVALAAAADIPVVSIDGTSSPDVDVNVTADNHAMGVKLAKDLFDALGGKGNVVKFYHSAHPGVHAREMGLDEVLADYPDIKVVAEHFVKVPGPIDDGRIAMENILRQFGDTIDGVWAGFDDPGIGAELAAESVLPDAKFIIMGVDGNAQAVDMIRSCTHYKETLRQDFAGMSTLAAAQLEKILNGEAPDAPELYVPVVAVTPETLGVTCE